MPKVRYSNKAVEDLTSIWEYTFSEWSESHIPIHHIQSVLWWDHRWPSGNQSRTPRHILQHHGQWRCHGHSYPARKNGHKKASVKPQRPKSNRSQCCHYRGSIDEVRQDQIIQSAATTGYYLGNGGWLFSMCDWVDGRTKVSRNIDQSHCLFMSRIREKMEYISCRMREIQIPAKFCTSRTGKRPPSPKSHREVKKTGLFCTSRMV